MAEFRLNKEKLSAIAQELGLEQSSLKAFLPIFEGFYETVRVQHLASVMRAMELYVRAKHGKPSFRIEWKPMSKDDTDSEVGVGLSWPDRYGIAVPPDLSLRQLRVYVAHELGHLFYVTEHPKDRGNVKLNQDMANVFGIFTMLERNKFYKEKAPDMGHATWVQVLNDFKQLSNREQGKLGVS